MSGPVSPAQGNTSADIISSVLASSYGALPLVLSTAGVAARALGDGLGRSLVGACSGGGGASSASASASSLAVSAACAGGGGAFSSPGGAAVVEPLTPAARAAIAQVMVLQFDPYLGGAVNSSGRVVVVVTLQDAAGDALPVAGLTQLITLTLPTGGGLSPGLVAAPMFWNTSTAAYSAAGLAWIPNPAPPAAQLTIDWASGFDAASDDVLPRAWAVSGMAASGCEDASLDCGVPGQRSSVVETCPGDAASQRWACGGRTAGVFRIWTGCGCALWRVPPDAAAPACGWNVSTQAFQGGGCVASDATRVGTRHLTAFTVQAQPPEIRTLSAADLVAISPQDLVHIKDLLILICCMFVGMHVGAFLLSRLDTRDMKRLLAMARSDALGCQSFAVNGDTLLTWRLTQHVPAGDAGDAEEAHRVVVAGPAVAFASMVGIPYARLALAVPETMFGLQPVCCSVGRRPADSGLASSDKLQCSAPADEPDMAMVAGTSFMHALQLSWCMASGDEVMTQQRLFLAFMEQQRSAVERGQFLRLFTVFKEMLIAGNLRGAKNWLPKARLWRVVLLSCDAGFWDPSDALALALLANNKAEPATVLHGVQSLMAALSSLAAVLIGSCVSGSDPSDGDLATAGAESAARTVRLASRRARLKPSRVEDIKGSVAADLSPVGDGTYVVDDGEVEERDEGFGGSDDPLCFCATAITETVPEQLSAALGHDETRAARVWTTALVGAYIDSNPLFTWRVSAASVPLAEQRTLLDAAEDWVQAQLRGAPAVHAFVMAAARHRVNLWIKYNDRRMTRQRKSLIGSREHAGTEMHRAVAMVHNALVTQHPTVSLITTEFAVGFVRWMGFVVLVSTLTSMLVVSIWFCALPPRCTWRPFP
jgi:hypothetical protein